MTRISLQEQYENKDVIQQINILKDDVNRVSETTDNVNKDVIQQINNVKDDISKVSGTTEEVKTLAQQASDTADTAVASIQGLVASGSIIADTVSARLKLNKVSGASEDSVIPIASASQTGMMNAQTYAGITNLDARVSALEGKSTTVYVTFPNDDPEQSIITSTFQTKAGRPPVAGDYAMDITRNLTYGYDGSVWVKVDSDVPIPQFSVDTPGLIKGNDEDGTVFAEANGTGSVKGWDALKQSVTNNSTAIAQNSTAIEQNSTAIASKLDKNQGTANSGKTFQVGDDGNVELVPFPDAKINNIIKINSNYIKVSYTSDVNPHIIVSGGEYTEFKGYSTLETYTNTPVMTSGAKSVFYGDFYQNDGLTTSTPFINKIRKNIGGILSLTSIVTLDYLFKSVYPNTVLDTEIFNGYRIEMTYRYSSGSYALSEMYNKDMFKIIVNNGALSVEKINNEIWTNKAAGDNVIYRCYNIVVTKI